MSDSLQSHGLQHARPPCPSPSPRVCSNSCPESVMPSNHLVLCCPLLPPSIFPSVRVFSSESALCIRWAKYCSFSFRISPSNEYSRLISFRIGWFAAAAAKSLQSCPTLCDPIDGSPPGSAVPGILQARTLEWVAISSSLQFRGLSRVFSSTTFQKHQFFKAQPSLCNSHIHTCLL